MALFGRGRTFASTNGGFGLAACPSLGLLVISDTNASALHVFELPRLGQADASKELLRLCTLHADSPSNPMPFLFEDGDFTAWLAFCGPPSARLLLVTDAGSSAVHVVDVVRQLHVGYVAPPGSIAGPRGVAARGSQVAVSACTPWSNDDPTSDCTEHVVQLFEGSGGSWTRLWVVGGGYPGPGGASLQLRDPCGLRFTSDGTGLVVAEYGNRCVSMVRVKDGAFVRHIATEMDSAFDVEEC